MMDHDPFVLRRMLALRKFPMFSNAELGDLALVAENIAETSYPARAVIAAAGARPPALHLVVEGEITMRAPRRASWGPSDVFGALEVLARRELTSPAIAARETRTLQLFSSDVTEVLEESFGVLRATLRELAARLAELAEKPPVIEVGSHGDPLGFLDRLILLRRQPLLSGARLDALTMLAHASDELRFAPGSALVRAGELATATHLVVEGTLRATDDTGIVHTLAPGDSIGSLETLAEMSYPATIEALTPARTLATGASALFDTLEDHTDLGLAMIATFASALADRAQPRRLRRAQITR